MPCCDADVSVDVIGIDYGNHIGSPNPTVPSSLPRAPLSSYFACACLNAPPPSVLLALVVVLKAKDLIKLGVYRLTLRTFFSRGQWYVHLHTNVNASLRVPSMQLHCAAYHVFQSRRRVHHIIAVAVCKANAGFPSRSG